ncbi:biopolymer transporter ExbD [Pontiellaceae bacterium B1224]|nr:biopolymer transporter ExbD [Pontiellaceae bacterium B1224]
MDLAKSFEDASLKLDMSSLIDVVFLLLIYFLVTASLIQKEADIGFMLPADIPEVEMREIPVEVNIQIKEDGTVEIEGVRFAFEDHDLKDLVTQVAGLKEIAASQNSPFYVNVLPAAEAIHLRIIDVMDACAAAGVNSLTFGKTQ